MNEELTQQVAIEIEQPPILQENTMQPGTSDPWAVWRTEESENPHVERLEELDQFLGVQEIGKWVFMMKLKYTEGVREVQDPNNPFATVPGSAQPFQEMALTIDKAEVGELQMMHLDEWQEEAVRRLLAEAEVSLLENDLDPTGVHPEPEKQLLFALQRRGSKIARITRRGRGNVLIGTKGALKQLSIDEEWNKAVRQMYKIVEVPDGYAGTKGDFAMVGYKGSNKYDTSLALSLAPKPMKSGKYFGSIVGQNIKDYWKKII